MFDDDLEMKGARASAALVFIELSRNIPVPAPKGLAFDPKCKKHM